MTSRRTPLLCIAAIVLASPALFAQPLLYQLSVPAVSTGAVQTAAISLQFVAPPLLLPPPPDPPLDLTQQPNFVLTGSPQPGYAVSFARLFGGSNDNFGLGFQNGPGVTIVYNLLGNLPAPAAPGSYVFQGNVQSNPAGGGFLTVGSQLTATLTISAAMPPTLSYSPQTLSFAYTVGGLLPQSQTVDINSTGSALSFTASPVNAGYLTVAVSSSTTPATLTVTANPVGLGPGNYSGTIQLSAPGAANPSASIPVSLSISANVPSGPVPFASQISNSASYAVAGAPNSGIAQGSLFAIFGINLGPQTLAQSGYPLTTSLSGTAAKVTVGTTSTDALPLYTSIGQVAAILPSRTATGTGTLVVTYNGTPGMSVRITIVVPSSFGTATVASNGLGPGIITGADYIVKTLSAPAKPGETLILWGTGLGAITGDESNPPTPVNQFSPQVLVGTATARVAYAGRSSCCAGLDQINFVVPSGVEGCYVPVSVQSGGITSNFTSLPIASSGPCVPSPGFNASLMNTAVSGGAFKIGVIAVGPAPILQSFGFSLDQPTANAIAQVLGRKVDADDMRILRQARLSSPAQQRAAVTQLMKKYGVRSKDQAKRLEPLLRALLGNNSEGAFAAFGAFTGVGSYSSQLLSDLPPSGTCTVFPSLPTGSSPSSSARGLEAGAQLSLSSPAGTKTLTRTKAGEYKVLLGSGFAVSQAPTGTYRVTGSGGTDVGSFSASLNVSNSLSWVNENATNTVDRTQPLTVTWTGGPNPGHILFGGIVDTRDGAFFLCTEGLPKRIAYGSFTGPICSAPHREPTRLPVPDGRPIGELLHRAGTGCRILSEFQ